MIEQMRIQQRRNGAALHVVVDGMPIEITGKSNDVESLAEQYRKLAWTWKEKQANVGATQEVDRD